SGGALGAIGTGVVVPTPEGANPSMGMVFAGGTRTIASSLYSCRKNGSTFLPSIATRTVRSFASSVLSLSASMARPSAVYASTFLAGNSAVVTVRFATLILGLPGPLAVSFGPCAGMTYPPFMLPTQEQATWTIVRLPLASMLASACSGGMPLGAAG